MPNCNQLCRDLSPPSSVRFEVTLLLCPRADAAFCVCKPGTPDAMLQKAIDYACSKGADCAQTTQGGPCYGNGNKVAVCSYICNSYFQSKSSMGATCDFGGVATLTTTDPSSGTCKFASGPR